MTSAFAAIFADVSTAIAFMLVAIFAFVLGMMAEHRVMTAQLDGERSNTRRWRRTSDKLAEELVEKDMRLFELELEVANYREERALQ